MADHFFLQRSGELVTKFGLNAENEIIHTLAFLAGAMVWSQVLMISNEITTVLVLYIVSCDLMRLIFFRNEEIPVLSYIILNFNGISQN